MTRKLGKRMTAMCEALEMGATDIYGLLERTGFESRETQKLLSRGNAAGLWTRDKTHTPQVWTVRKDWREATANGELRRMSPKRSRGPNVPRTTTLKADRRWLEQVWNTACASVQ